MKLIAADVAPALVGNLLMGNLINRQYEPALAQAGDTVNIPITPSMTAANLAEGGTVQTQNPKLGNAQIVLNTHAYAGFLIPDVTRALSFPDLIRIYMSPAIIAVAERIEQDIFGLYSFLTANAAVGTAGAAPTEGVIDSAERTLFEAKIPDSEPRILVVDSDAYSTIRQLPRYSEMDKIGNAAIDALANGTVRRIKDFNLFRSQYVKETGGGPVTTHNLGFTRNAMGMAMRRLPQPLPGTGAIAEYAEMGNFGVRVTMSYNPSTLSQQVTVDALYGVAVLDSRYAVEVQS